MRKNFVAPCESGPARQFYGADVVPAASALRMGVRESKAAVEFQQDAVSATS